MEIDVNNVLLMINLDKNIEETGKLVGTTGDSVVSTNTPKKKVLVVYLQEPLPVLLLVL